jgi:uncharacterized protein YndB with AHSA1/START domain
LTKDGGWQIGARKTIGAGLETTWQALVSEAGLKIWLGPVASLADGDEFHLSDGTVCHVRIYKPNSHLRLGWRPPQWERSSTIQVRVIPSGAKTVIAFHQEGMPTQDARRQRQAFFKEALERLDELLSQ